MRIWKHQKSLNSIHNTLRSHYMCPQMIFDGRGSSTLIFRNVKKCNSRNIIKGECFAPPLFSFRRRPLIRIVMTYVFINYDLVSNKRNSSCLGPPCFLSRVSWFVDLIYDSPHQKPCRQFTAGC